MKPHTLAVSLTRACISGLLISLAGCTFAPDDATWQDVAPINRAVAVLHPTQGYDVAGQVTFVNVAGVFEINGEFRGLTPGQHGIHIHEFGDCSAADGTSAGGHFNPDEVRHGGPDSAVRHVGDLGNIVADSTGTATIDAVDARIAFRGRNSIIGRAVIVHAGPDDFVSQPSGDAGDRIACGVIGISAD